METSSRREESTDVGADPPHTEGREIRPMAGPERAREETRLRPSRRTIGVCDSGETFDVTDDWRSRELADEELPRGWAGRRIFLVDRGYTRDFGTVQRRQRSAVANVKGRARVSWADEDDSI